MKAWAIASAALSLTALCACSSTEDEKAPGSDANVEDQWKYHVKKNYPQWQAPAEVSAPAQAQSSAAAVTQEGAAPSSALIPAAPVSTGVAPATTVLPSAAPAAVPATAPLLSGPSAETGFVEPKGFVVKDNVGAYVSPKPETPHGDGFSHYTVKKGDSLWTISKMIYHRADKWQKIYDVNKDAIKDPNRLKPGTDLKIPAP
jgi:nucleoid-associated protein YgaU